MPAVTVIVPAYNSASTIGRALEALEGQDLSSPFEVIVVDDGSDDQTVAIAERAARSGIVRVLRQDHLGPGPARNRGAAEASSPALAFTDADCIPAVDWLRVGLDALRDSDLVQGAILPEGDVARHPFDHTISVERETGLFETANLFVTRELFERLGGFEDWLGPVVGKPLAEDVWFGWRARRLGARIAFCGRAIVHHAVSRRSLAQFLAERRRLVYFPRIAAQIPELRSRLFRSWWLTPRSAAFDLALLGVVVGAASRRPLPLVVCLPYGWLVVTGALGWRKRAPLAALSTVLGDAVGFAALAWGSVRAKTLLI